MSRLFVSLLLLAPMLVAGCVSVPADGSPLTTSSSTTTWTETVEIAREEIMAGAANGFTYPVHFEVPSGTTLVHIQAKSTGSWVNLRWTGLGDCTPPGGNGNLGVTGYGSSTFTADCTLASGAQSAVLRMDAGQVDVVFVATAQVRHTSAS